MWYMKSIADVVNVPIESVMCINVHDYCFT